MDKREIFTAIFGKENVLDEELWNLGFALSFEDKIEVESKNFSQYGKYKQKMLYETFFSKIEEVKTSWVKLPDSQKEQIDVIMKMIVYAAVSLETCVTVENVTDATIRFLQRLGYNAWRSSYAGWIAWDEAKKVDNKTIYLTAETAKNLSNFINIYVFASFLEDEKSRGKEYAIIPVTEIPIDCECDDIKKVKSRVSTILENLSMDFDLETFVTSHNCKPLVFIDLRHFSLNKEVQMKRLEPLKNYLTVKR